MRHFFSKLTPWMIFGTMFGVLFGYILGELERGIDHRPFMGAKFLGARTGNAYSFHGYNEGLEKDVDDVFKSRVEIQFNKQ